MAKVVGALTVVDDASKTKQTRSATGVGRTLSEAFVRVWHALTEGEHEVTHESEFAEFGLNQRPQFTFRFDAQTEWVDSRHHRIQSGAFGQGDSLEEVRQQALRVVGPRVGEEIAFEDSLAEAVSAVVARKDDLTGLLSTKGLERGERDKIVKARDLLAQVENDIVARDADLVIVGS